MKRKLSLIILLALLPIVAYAYDAYIGGIYYNLSGEEARVTYKNTSYNSYTGSVIIPETITYNGKTYTVTSIGDHAFYGCSSLTSITIPNSVTSIGSSAFGECSGLTSITIPNSVTYIDYSAFYGCTGLTSITIPNSVTSIGSAAFEGCTGMTSIIIPNSVTSIGHNAFWLCTGLTSVIIPNSVTSIGRNAFNGCTGLTSITIPNSVTSIGDGAFSGCTGLTSVTIPESVTSIGAGAFFQCTGLTSITIPNSMTSIGTYAFSGCSSLTSITIPNSMTSIGTYAFYICTGLTSVTIPESVTSIEESAFSGCSGLTSITIPNSVTSIDYSAFSGCSGLTSITIPNSVRSISSYAFYGCTGLTSVTIGNGVTSIGTYAFSGCSGLISVTLNNNSIVSAKRTSSTSMKSIFGEQVKEYVIGDDVKSIGDYSFYGCTNLTTINIPNGVTSIGSYAFSGCSGLTSVTIPNSVTNIGENAFYGCSSLTSVFIPEKMISIGYRAFYNCNNVKLYVKGGTDGLLAIWNYGLEAYEAGTTQTLLRPSVSEVSKTQTTIKYRIINYNLYPELKYEINGNGESMGNDEYLIKGLRPDYEHTIKLTVISANNSYSTSSNIRTSPISPTITCENQTASSLAVSGSYTKGDAKVVSRSIIINGVEMDGEKGAIHGLDPNISYTCKYRVVVEDDNGEDYEYYGSQSIRTASLSLSTQQPKVISSGNVIVAAISNLDDEETKVGFEWRRIDWTDDFTSNTGGAYLFGGKMEGYIRNLNTDKLWKYRPYYESDTGKRYYGDWLGIDPTNTSYFEPTVYTYSSYSVTDNTAEVKGYAMRGSDNVTNQGFMYWKKDSNGKSIPANAKMVEVKGNVMNATLENLDYDTEYCYVAFVTTSENETFYGEEQTFKTGIGNQEMIDGIESLTPSLSKGEGGIYDLQGRKLSIPQKGINIIRMKDGTTRKVMMK